MHQIQHYSADSFRAALKRLLKDQLDVRDDGTARYTSATSGMVNLRFDAEDQSCELQGDREIVDQFLTLFDWFERVRDRASGESIHFVPLRNVRPDVLNRAIHLCLRLLNQGGSSPLAGQALSQIVKARSYQARWC